MPGGAFCGDCFEGYYAADSGNTQCAGCPVGQYQSSKARSRCDMCPPGKFAPNKGSVYCSDCRRGYYESSTGSSSCTKCPEGSKCVKNGDGFRTAYIATKGWYLLEKPDGNQEPIKCQHGESGSACLEGGQCHVDPDTGEPSMEGLFCGKCRPGYGRAKAEGLCYKCPPLFVSALYCLGALGFTVMLSGVIFVVVVSTDFTKPKNLSAVILKQLLNYLGMSTVVLRATDLRFPFDVGFMDKVLHYVQVVFGVKSLDFAAHSSECFTAHFTAPHKANAILALVWVPVLIVGLTLIFLLLKCIRGAKGPEISKLMTLLIVNLFIVHPKATELCLSVFHCGHFDEPRLMMDPGVDCQSQEHGLWQLLGMVCFIVYSVGIPFGTFFSAATLQEVGLALKQENQQLPWLLVLRVRASALLL